jgi:hypothetical protein
VPADPAETGRVVLEHLGLRPVDDHHLGHPGSEPFEVVRQLFESIAVAPAKGEYV